MRTLRRLSLLILPLTLVGTVPGARAAEPAAALSPAPKKAKKPSACRDDRARLCAGVKGREATRACMLSRREQLSPTCRTVIDRAEASKKDCQIDADRLCSEVKPGHGRTMACLIGRKAEVAPACRTHVDAAIARYKKTKSARKPTSP
jgi:hypothetical protein